MIMKTRSGCPVNQTIELIGDRWTMVILRDIMFGNRRTFRELLGNSLEGIASNILSARLKMLLSEGLLTRKPDPGHKQKSIYSLTEKSIELVPLMVQLGAWGRRHLSPTHELSVRAELLENGGNEMWERFQDDLRHIHLGHPRKTPGMTVLELLDNAYRKAAGITGQETGQSAD